VTVETFKREIAEALKAYQTFIVCIDKTPDHFEDSLNSLLNKAIHAYENRGPHLRHGIALDNQVTVILSQTETAKPLCGIYFNLHSPYQKHSAAKSPKAVTEGIGEGRSGAER
jgi:hypothetical protein